MPDAVAAVAPVTASTPEAGATPDLQAPAKGGAPNGAPGRGADGKFQPGAQVKPTPRPAVEPKPPEPVKEPYRFKRKLKVDGKELDVDLDEEAIERELQIGRHLQRKAKSFKEGQSQAQRLFELAKEDPEAFLRETGHDPDEWAQRRLAQRAQLETMTEPERRSHELERENASLKAKFEADSKKAVEAQQAAQLERARQGIVARYKEALASAGEPANNEALYLMAETERLAIADAEERGLPAPAFTPAQLLAETRRRLDGMADGYVKGLEGPAFDKKFGPHLDRYLDGFRKPDPAKTGAFIPDGAALAKRLGPARVQAILEASVAEYESSQNFEPKPQAEEPPTPRASPGDKDPEYIDEYEAARRLRGLTR